MLLIDSHDAQCLQLGVKIVQMISNMKSEVKKFLFQHCHLMEPCIFDDQTLGMNESSIDRQS